MDFEQMKKRVSEATAEIERQMEESHQREAAERELLFPPLFYLLSCGEHDFQNHGIYDSQENARIAAIDYEKAEDRCGLHWQTEVYIINTNDPIEVISFMVGDAWEESED